MHWGGGGGGEYATRMQIGWSHEFGNCFVIDT